MLTSSLSGFEMGAGCGFWLALKWMFVGMLV